MRKWEFDFYMSSIVSHKKKIFINYETFANIFQYYRSLKKVLQIIKKNVIDIMQKSTSKGLSYIDKFHYHKRTKDNSLLALPYGNFSWIDDSHWRNYAFNWLRTLHGGVAAVNWNATSFK